eukprot:Rmarinus@m.1825
MAGRGREMTKPAWMKDNGPDSEQTFEGPAPPPAEGTGGLDGISASYGGEPGGEISRQRSRSPRPRSPPRGRSRSPRSPKKRSKSPRRASRSPRRRSRSPRRRRSRSPRRRRSRSRSPRRSRSRRRSPTRSRSRSATPPRRKRKSGWGNAAAGAVNSFGVPLQPGQQVPTNPAAMLTMQQTRHARRIYLGNIPLDSTEAAIQEFVNHTMWMARATETSPEAGGCVLSVYINYEKRFAFVEFRTMQEANNAMNLDGIVYRGFSLKVRRPTDYNPSAAAALENQITGATNASGASQTPASSNVDTASLGIISTTVADTPNKIFCGGIPYHLTDDQVKELISSFGQLKAFYMAKDNQTGMSKGYCFFEFVDPAITHPAINALNGMPVGDRTLTVRIANSALASGATTASGAAPVAGAPMELTRRETSKVICMREMVTLEELEDPEEYEDIVEDIREELSKYGAVCQVVVPKPGESGCGKVFVEFSNNQEAQVAQEALAGRRFSNRTVEANFYPESAFANKDYS